MTENKTEKRIELTAEELELIKDLDAYKKNAHIRASDIHREEDERVKFALSKEMIIRKKYGLKEIAPETEEEKRARRVESEKRYIEHYRRTIALANETEEQSRELKKVSNVDRLEYAREDWLKEAKPVNVPRKVGKKIIERDGKNSYIFSSESAINNKFLAESLVYGLVDKNIVSPYQIKRTTAIEAYKNIHGMYEAKEWKKNFFDNDAKLLVVENCSDSYSNTAPKGQEQFWKELVNFAEGRDIRLIITYSRGDKEIGDFTPNITGFRDLDKEIMEMAHMVNLSEDESAELSDVVRRGQS